MEKEKIIFVTEDINGLYLDTDIGLVFAVQACNCCQTCKES